MHSYLILSVLQSKVPNMMHTSYTSEQQIAVLLKTLHCQEHCFLSSYESWNKTLKVISFVWTGREALIELNTLFDCCYVTEVFMFY